MTAAITFFLGLVGCVLANVFYFRYLIESRCSGNWLDVVVGLGMLVGGPFGLVLTLSIGLEVFDSLFFVNMTMACMGGTKSCGWPLVSTLAAHRRESKSSQSKQSLRGGRDDRFKKGSSTKKEEW